MYSLLVPTQSQYDLYIVHIFSEILKSKKYQLVFCQNHRNILNDFSKVYFYKTELKCTMSTWQIDKVEAIEYLLAK